MKKLLAVIAIVLTLLASLPLTVFAEGNDAPKTNFGFYPESLKETLPIMGMGMLGIFAVICLIVLTVLVLRWMSVKLDKNEED